MGVGLELHEKSEVNAFGPKFGLFDRVSTLFELVEKLPDEMSDAEVEGVLAVIPKETSKGLSAMLIPRLRDVSLIFLKTIGKWLRDAKNAPLEGKKSVLVPFCFPPEIVQAFDSAFPVTSEVLSTIGVIALEGQGERYFNMALGLGLPDHICSANAVEIGSMLGSDDFQPQAIISAAVGSCDINSKTHEMVSNYYGIPQFILEKPVDDTERGHPLYKKNFRRLVGQLEEFFDEELTEEKLRRVVEKANKASELMLELWDIHSAVPHPVPNLFALFTYGTRFAMWGTDEAITTMQAMVDTSKKRLKNGDYPAEKEVARCILSYTSYYFDLANLFNWMEEQGYSYIGDGLDLLWPTVIDTTDRDTMLDGLAMQAWNMPMTRQVGGHSMSMCWLEDLIHVAKMWSADCAIYSGHHSCKQTWSVSNIVRAELMNRINVPMLNLQGDSWLKRTTPISVIQKEIDEFIKNVVLPKRVGKKKVRKRA
jgi:benzoyl-CoA reductase/2-hydroxyglutaryl-CoA dehydratase subunit BcrC/BadD/HgdB